MKAIGAIDVPFIARTADNVFRKIESNCTLYTALQITIFLSDVDSNDIISSTDVGLSVHEI